MWSPADSISRRRRRRRWCPFELGRGHVGHQRELARYAGQGPDASDWLRIEGVVEKLYEVQVVPGARRPSVIGFKTDEIRRTLRLPG